MFQIINSDIIEGLQGIKNTSVDLIFADPPYNLNKKYADQIFDRWTSTDEYIEWTKQWLDLAIEKLKPTGALYIMNSTQNMPYIDIYLREKIDVISRIIWFYDSSSRQAVRQFGSLYEPIIFAVKDKNDYVFNHQDIMIEAKTGAIRKLMDYRKNPPQPYNTKKVPGNVWEFPRVRFKMEEYEDHPSQKPEILLERIIKTSTNEYDQVLDLFAGTFSMGRVCKRLNRGYIGIELSKEYCQRGIERLKE